MFEVYVNGPVLRCVFLFMYSLLVVGLLWVKRIFVFFFISWFVYLRDLHVLTHSFPTRRSSVLAAEVCGEDDGRDEGAPQLQRVVASKADGLHQQTADRSEEHTSELQSLMRNSYADFCLKKKTG